MGNPEGDSELQPGRHKRKNAKQILASLRAVASRAGLDWEERAESSSRGRASVRRGTDPVLELTWDFGTTEIRFGLTPTGGETAEARAIYTDIEPALATLQRLLAARS